jgi:putative RNA 2'-phosphotransferase
MLKHQHKTLAKTLDYIIRRSPGEYGLFWDPDHTMPWKEFYHALQQDHSLRFVRESTIRELMLLGIELPFVFDGGLLRLRPEFAQDYPLASDVPKRLYYAIKPQKLVYTQDNGLKSAGRRFVALCSERSSALQFAARTATDPILLEILAKEAFEAGVVFYAGGQGLYLVESAPAQFIIFPKIRRSLVGSLSPPAGKPKKKLSPATPAGSFVVMSHHLQSSGIGEPFGKQMKSDSKEGRKKDRRKERHKREI